MTEGFFLAVQAAENQRSNGHNDSGSFIVFHDGWPVFVDVGLEAYSAKSFGPNRYSLWTMLSAFHNLPAVGGVMQSSAKQEYEASKVVYRSGDLRRIWGQNLYLVLVTSAAPIDGGTWKIGIV